MRNTFLTLLGILMIPALSWAQAPGAVRFQSGTETFPENGNAFSLTTLNPSEVVEGRYYRFVQFYQTPTAQQRAQMEREGLQFLGYIPKSTYMVSFPVNYDRAQLATHGVYSVMPIEAHHKMEHALVHGSLPAWAVKGDRIDLTIAFPADQAYATIVGNLQAEGIDVLSGQRLDPTIEIQLPINQMGALAAKPYITWVEAIVAPSVPDDNRGRGLSRANVIDSDNPLGRQYDGSGIRILVRDDGPVEDHIDYKGRLIIDGATRDAGSFHGHMVAGVFTGAGNLDPRNRGTAPGADVYTLDYDASFTDGTLNLHIFDSVMITNSSYSNGCNGGYTTIAQRVDNQGYTYKNLLHVFSAGNSNNNNCGYYNGTQFGNITGGHKQGKNVMAVGNLNVNGTIVNSSSRGPADDGRLKPDISANGNGQVSTDYGQTLQGASGTSAAAPTAAGSMAQLYQAYRTLNNNEYPQAALMKAIVMNTAEDYGRPGPDFDFGWGRMNAFRALQILEKNQYFADTIGQGQQDIHQIIVPAGVSEMRVMVYWNDPAGLVNSNVNLVNDLDMIITDTSSNTDFLPLILDYRPNTNSLTTDAFPGRDSINNVEQVRITNPAAGAYPLTVQGTDVPSGPQEYFVVYEFITDEITVTYPYGGEQFVPGENEFIHWDAYGNQGTFTIEYSLDSGTVWQPMATVNGSQRLYGWQVPNTVSGDALIRVTRGTQSGQSEYTFTVLDVPENLQVLAACSTVVSLSWESVAGASAYQVYLLGEKYMDPVVTSSDTFACVPIPSFLEPQWFSVSAITPDGQVGQRTIALQISPDEINCEGNGVEIASVLQPASPQQSLCNGDSMVLSFAIFNSSANTQVGYNYGYQLDQQSPVVQASSNTLDACASAIEGFVIPLDTLAAGIHELKIWTNFPGDSNPSDDTLSFPIEILSLPVREDFETFLNCNTFTDCGATECGLANQWRNPVNGVEDDIDWRTNSGPTASNGTGPVSDHTTGNFSGKYLYLESSSCFNSVAYLESPCLDLQEGLPVVLEFWYHMSGTAMGSLHLDINIGDGWILDIMPPLVGNQGNNWLEMKVNLTPYVGSNATLRFRGVTGQSFTSDMAIDDITIKRAIAPTAVFGLSADSGCVARTVVISDSSAGDDLTYQWNFGPGATPATATTPGPHIVSWNVPGVKVVSLLVFNEFGNDARVLPFKIDADPTSDFNFLKVASSTYDFTSQASANAGILLWDFGDGTISTSPNPTHTYTARGTYIVTLSASNSCNTAVKTDTIQVDVVTSIAGNLQDLAIEVAPNPAHGSFQVVMQVDRQGEVNLSLLDLRGKAIEQRAFFFRGGIHREAFVADGLAEGIYLLRIQMGDEEIYRRVAIK